MSIIIGTRYAGGNVKVIANRGDTVQLEQEIRDTTEWWFYWNFHAISDRERETVFEFVNGEVIGPWGPSVSEDGVHWRWLGKESLLSRQSFRYRFQAGERVWFAFGFPYQVQHFEQFYARYAEHPLVRRDVLTVSEQLQAVPLLRIGRPDAERHILFTCRHHACEAPPSYLLEGLLSHYLDQPASVVLDRYCIHYVPFVDIDGVENGDQGKSRAPHDHNRDYREEPIYRTTAAVTKLANSVKPVVGIDFHSPFKWGSRHDRLHFVKLGEPYKTETDRLSAHLQRISGEREDADALRHLTAFDLDLGVEWNQPHGQNCCSCFARAGAKLAVTFEFPYFGLDTPYTPDNSRRFGVDMARALEAYLFEEL